MKVHLYGLIALALLVAGSIGAGYLGQEELALILGGAAAGTFVPSPVRSRE